MSEYGEGFDRGYDHGYTAGYGQGRHDQLMELGKMLAGETISEESMCRCGHENADHKQMFDDGRPTSNFPCHGYGCVCGIFDAIDWDESDANMEAMMDYQRSIKL